MKKALMVVTLALAILLSTGSSWAWEMVFSYPADCSLAVQYPYIFSIGAGEPFIMYYVNEPYATFTAQESGEYMFFLGDGNWMSSSASCYYDYSVRFEGYCDKKDSPPLSLERGGSFWDYKATIPAHYFREDDYCSTDGYYYGILDESIYYAYMKRVPRACGASIPIVPQLVRQCDARWRNTQYDSTSNTICLKGCGLASLVMLMNSKGCYPDFLATNACTGCFESGSVKWSTMLSSFCSKASFVKKARYTEFKNVKDAGINFDKDIRDGYNYILQVKNKSGQCGHFVFMTGVSDDCHSLTVLDPAKRVTSVSEICGYRKFK